MVMNLKYIQTGIIVILIGIIVKLFLINDDGKYKIEIENLKKSNDSLFTNIQMFDKKIDSISQVNIELEKRNSEINIKLSSLNKKSNELKKQHEKDIEFIDNLSNNDITDIFTDKFTNIR